MSTLVTGATTPLGQRVVEMLLESGHGRVLAVGFEPASVVQFDSRVVYRRVDLTRARQVRELMHGTVREMNIDTVIHLAMHRSARFDRNKAHRLHVDATRLLLRLSESHPTVSRFVHRSSSEVYLSRNDQPDVLREDQPLNLSVKAGQWIRDRVEADVTVCARMGLSPTLHVNVLRCAEILAPDMGSQLHDYLSSRVCFRPLGFDPIVNLLSLEDASRAFALALHAKEPGVVNIPGADTLPLSAATRKWGRDSLAVPGAWMGPMYALRARLRNSEFRYDLNVWRFHFNGVLDGARARRVLEYEPASPVQWPEPVFG
ncbi:MAG: NAD-dependent epimerase/dehydratase family protein [Proteobacteria bacterium]|nr:NAD-dependent epimerase/dehydratase family protein [Pseudomonadota bacterium]